MRASKEEKKRKEEAAKARKEMRESRRALRTDMSYWGMPLYQRIYLRVFYAIAAFVITGGIFDVWLHAPFWMQIVMASCVSLSVLLFRMAYPNGFSDIFGWIQEGMAMAIADKENDDKDKAKKEKETKK